MKNIFLKTAKFIISRLFYLALGIFLAIGATYVYATWDQAKTGGSEQLSENNWNALVNELHNKCGSNCDEVAVAATASDDILTETNWNNLIDLANDTLVDCADNNGGKCFINQTAKSSLDTDLVASNIKSGIDVFGVTGTASVNTGNIRCKVGRTGYNWSNWCTLGTDCNASVNAQWWTGCGYVYVWSLTTTTGTTDPLCRYQQMDDCGVAPWQLCWQGDVICEIYQIY